MAKNALRPRPNATHASASRGHVKPAPAGIDNRWQSAAFFRDTSSSFRFRRPLALDGEIHLSGARSARRPPRAELAGRSRGETVASPRVPPRVSRKARSRRERTAGAVAWALLPSLRPRDDMTDANRGFVKLWANKKERQQYGASLLGGCRERSERLAERTARGTAPISRASRD